MSVRPAPANDPSFRFPRQRRLLKSEAFTHVFRDGVRSSDSFFTLLAVATNLDGPRLGMAISRKVAGTAVARNRLRRIIREHFRLNQHDLPAMDIVAMVKRDAVTAEAAELRLSLAKHWKQLARKCAES